MRTSLALGVLTGLLCLPASPVAAQPVEASLSFVSDPGDYIGGGQSRLFTIDTASFSVRGNQDGRYVGVTVFPFAGGFWFVDLAAPEGARLDPGSYEGAIRYPFQAPDQPGLSVSGDGRGCNTLTGRFDVLEAKFGPGGYVERFHATFEQHCEGATGALRGEIFIVNPPPPPALAVELTVDSAGAVDQRTGKARVSGTLACTIAASANRNGGTDTTPHAVCARLGDRIRERSVFTRAVTVDAGVHAAIERAVRRRHGAIGGAGLGIRRGLRELRHRIENGRGEADAIAVIGGPACSRAGLCPCLRTDAHAIRVRVHMEGRVARSNKEGGSSDSNQTGKSKRKGK